MRLNSAHNFISRLAAVHQVGQQDGVLGAGEAAGGHLPGTFLNRDSLVVLVDCLQEGEICPEVEKELLEQREIRAAGAGFSPPPC